MEPSFYHFAVLRYRPSYLLGEVVNIGVLFWFLEEGKFVFVAPTHLERLKSLYIAANLVNIRLGLKHFDLQAKILSSQKSEISRHIFDEKVLTEHFLLKDANAFTFSDWKKGDMNGKTSNELVEYHQKQYLYHYYKNHQTTPHDEAYLKNKFKQILQQAPDKKQLFNEKVIIDSNRVKYEAPYAWQNGTLNIVTPLSFDLREAQSIQNKAVKWFGLLYHLREAAEIQNLKFDLLVAQPTDARLTNAYEDALGIVQDISDLQHRLCVWHETEIDNYARYALNNAVTPLPVA